MSTNRRTSLLPVPILWAAVEWGLAAITETVKWFRARYTTLFLPYIPQTLETEWNQGCQPRFDLRSFSHFA